MGVYRRGGGKRALGGYHPCGDASPGLLWRARGGAAVERSPAQGYQALQTVQTLSDLMVYLTLLVNVVIALILIGVRAIRQRERGNAAAGSAHQTEGN